MLKLRACIDVARSEARFRVVDASAYRLQALDLWLSERGDATISVGVISADEARRCSVTVHEHTFTATSTKGGFEGSWSAIVAACELAELHEREAGINPDAEPDTMTPDELVSYLDRMGLG